MRFSLLLSLLTARASGCCLGEFRLATFSADITVPIGHGMMGGSWQGDPGGRRRCEPEQFSWDFGALICLVFGRCASDMLGT
jgi:hypothetical protein